MIHPHTELRFVDPEVGLGLFATAPIPKGTVVWVLDPLDQVLTPERRAVLDPVLRAQLDRYAFTDDQGHLVLCWDHGRFVNHSCEANCLGPDGSNFEIAVRDIAAGEQLTDDYRSLGLQEADAFRCLCGSASCEGWVDVPTPLLNRRWERQVEAALSSFFSVPQPLAAWLSRGDLEDAFPELPDEHDGYSEIIRRIAP